MRNNSEMQEECNVHHNCCFNQQPLHVCFFLKVNGVWPCCLLNGCFPYVWSDPFCQNIVSDTWCTNFLFLLNEYFLYDFQVLVCTYMQNCTGHIWTWFLSYEQLKLIEKKTLACLHTLYKFQNMKFSLSVSNNIF